ncbi:MAG: DUF2096 domain-containing protein [Candidatus Bathyarchaeota archaeon]|nr:DUF2096 domain-containing protein [Candidatus Bathyarchaeota archaeon]
MGYLAVWKILEEIIIELRRKGQSIPAAVMNDLRAAQTMIKIMNASGKHGDASQKIEEYLSTVEARLVTEAQKHFPPERIDEWLRRIEQANIETDSGDDETRFIAGVPRDQKWIRVEPLANLPLERLEQLAKETNLSAAIQKDGRMIVYGQADDLKDFIKKMTEQTGKK